MYFNPYGYGPHINQYANYPYREFPYMSQQQPAYNHYDLHYSQYSEDGMERQHAVRGQATWTQGGPVTECGIPWSNNHYMTAAVGAGSPYKCGQILRVKNLSSPDHKEITVKVVDQVPGYPPNKINLHRRAFESLGANPQVGVIQVEIRPLSEAGQGEWGAYLAEVIQTAFPGYNVTGYQSTGKTEMSATETEEVFTFTLQSSQETRRIRAAVHYIPNANRVTSINIKEI